MQFKRQVIRAWDAMNLKNLNDNFMYLWLKVFKNIETGDIEDGAITADKIKAGELEVGKNIKMGPNATMDWNTQLVNKPTDLVKSSDLANYVDKTYFGNTLKNYPTNNDVNNALANYLTQGQLSQTLADYVSSSALTTKLGQDYVITGKILANQIVGGSITGCTLQTANGTNFVSLQNQFVDIYNNNNKCVSLGFNQSAEGVQFPRLYFSQNISGQGFITKSVATMTYDGLLFSEISTFIQGITVLGNVNAQTIYSNNAIVATQEWVRNNVSSSSGGVSYVNPYGFGSSGTLAMVNGSGGSIYFEKAADGRFIFHTDSSHYVAIDPSVCQWNSY